MTAREELAERFRRLEGRGLRSVRFTMDKGCSLEQACAEVNALYRAVEAGHEQALDFGDSLR